MRARIAASARGAARSGAGSRRTRCHGGGPHPCDPGVGCPRRRPDGDARRSRRAGRAAWRRPAVRPAGGRPRRHVARRAGRRAGDQAPTMASPRAPFPTWWTRPFPRTLAVQRASPYDAPRVPARGWRASGTAMHRRDVGGAMTTGPWRPASPRSARLPRDGRTSMVGLGSGERIVGEAVRGRGGNGRDQARLGPAARAGGSEADLARRPKELGRVDGRPRRAALGPPLEGAIPTRTAAARRRAPRLRRFSRSRTPRGEDGEGTQATGIAEPASRQGRRGDGQVAALTRVAGRRVGGSVGRQANHRRVGWWRPEGRSPPVGGRIVRLPPAATAGPTTSSGTGSAMGGASGCLPRSTSTRARVSRCPPHGARAPTTCSPRRRSPSSTGGGARARRVR